jgi:hypothetical protein
LQEGVEEYQGGSFDEPFAVGEEELDVDLDEEKEERSWKRE